jgi:hypothetical protein
VVGTKRKRKAKKKAKTGSSSFGSAAASAVSFLSKLVPESLSPNKYAKKKSAVEWPEQKIPDAAHAEDLDRETQSPSVLARPVFSRARKNFPASPTGKLEPIRSPSVRSPSVRSPSRGSPSPLRGSPSVRSPSVRSPLSPSHRHVSPPAHVSPLNSDRISPIRNGGDIANTGNKDDLETQIQKKLKSQLDGDGDNGSDMGDGDMGSSPIRNSPIQNAKEIRAHNMVSRLAAVRASLVEQAVRRFIC